MALREGAVTKITLSGVLISLLSRISIHDSGTAYALFFSPGRFEEMHYDMEQKIARPRQIWTGHEVREFVPLSRRATVAGTRGT